MSLVSITMDEAALKKLIVQYLQDKLGGVGLDSKDVRIEVKSKQNYKSEWESAAFRATVEKVIP